MGENRLIFIPWFRQKEGSLCCQTAWESSSPSGLNHDRVLRSLTYSSCYLIRLTSLKEERLFHSLVITFCELCGWMVVVITCPSEHHSGAYLVKKRDSWKDSIKKDWPLLSLFWLGCCNYEWGGRGVCVYVCVSRGEMQWDGVRGVRGKRFVTTHIQGFISFPSLLRVHAIAYCFVLVLSRFLHFFPTSTA